MGDKVFEKVRELLASQFEVDINTISKDTNIVDDLGADSLDFVELFMMMEEEFGIVVTDETMYTFKTVEEVTNFILDMLDKTDA